MGQAKQRGTKEERIKQAQLVKTEYTAEEIETATQLAHQAGCSVEKALESLRIIRKKNDEAAGELGYKRAGLSENGQAMFVKEEVTELSNEERQKEEERLLDARVEELEAKKKLETIGNPLTDAQPTKEEQEAFEKQLKKAKETEQKLKESKEKQEKIDKARELYNKLN